MSSFCFVCFVFLFKQKTAYEMRISDWSSDVCSSDLAGTAVRQRATLPAFLVIGRQSVEAGGDVLRRLARLGVIGENGGGKNAGDRRLRDDVGVADFADQRLHEMAGPPRPLAPGAHARPGRLHHPLIPHPTGTTPVRGK